MSIDTESKSQQFLRSALQRRDSILGKIRDCEADHERLSNDLFDANRRIAELRFQIWKEGRDRQTAPMT